MAQSGSAPLEKKRKSEDSPSDQSTVHKSAAGMTALVAVRGSWFKQDRKYLYEGISAVGNRLTVVTQGDVKSQFTTKAEVFEVSFDKVDRIEVKVHETGSVMLPISNFKAFPAFVVWSNEEFSMCGKDLHSLKEINDLNNCLTGCLLYSHSSFPGNKFYVLRESVAEQKPANVYDVNEVTVSATKDPLSRVIFQICYLGTPQAFDVSSDGEYIAVMRFCPRLNEKTSLHLNVYHRLDPESYGSFCTASQCSHAKALEEEGTASSDVTGDICFSKYKGREVLRVAVSQDNLVYVLDHTQGCLVLTSTEVYRPRRLASSQGGKLLWILSDQQVLVFNSA